MMAAVAPAADATTNTPATAPAMTVFLRMFASWRLCCRAGWLAMTLFRGQH